MARRPTLRTQTLRDYDHALIEIKAHPKLAKSKRGLTDGTVVWVSTAIYDLTVGETNPVERKRMMERIEVVCVWSLKDSLDEAF